MMTLKPAIIIFIIIVTITTCNCWVECFPYYCYNTKARIFTTTTTDSDDVIIFRSRCCRIRSTNNNNNRQQYNNQQQHHSTKTRSKVLLLYNKIDDNDDDSSSIEPIESTVPKQQQKPTQNVVSSRQDFIRDGLIKEFQESTEDMNRRNLIINTITIGLLGSVAVSSAYLYQSTVYTPSGFQRLPRTQFIAALGNPNDNSGTGATEWGIWNVDPGPRGIYLRDYETQLVANNYESPVYGWKFNPTDWWVEEHGIIMESPIFPIQPGRYLVTGGRSITTGLTINTDGSWKLDNNVKLYDVTHLPCRSGRYSTTPLADNSASSSSDNQQQQRCVPSNANVRSFPVPPGAVMPTITGCNKQDYAVLFVVGKAITQ